jgi:hypothetical protein
VDLVTIRRRLASSVVVDVNSAACGDYQALHINSHAHRSKWLQTVQALLELDPPASLVATLEMVVADANQQNALIERANRVRLPSPEGLKRLVAVPIVAGVELCDTGK